MIIASFIKQRLNLIKETVPMMKNFLKFLKEEDGVTSIEYVLIASFIALIIILSVQTAGAKVSSVFNKVANLFNS